MQVLPIFPLAALAVPGLRLPLRIFEPRYLEMVEDLMRRPEPERQFGVIALKLGQESGDGPTQLYEVGTVVSIQRVRPRGDGSLSLVALGQYRFRLLSLVPEPDSSYLVGRAEALQDVVSEGPQLQGVAATARDALQALNSQFGTPDEELPSEPRTLSHVILTAAPLPYPDRQRLLDISDVAERLRQATVLMRRERALFAQLRAVAVSEPWEFGSLN